MNDDQDGTDEIPAALQYHALDDEDGRSAGTHTPVEPPRPGPPPRSGAGAAATTAVAILFYYGVSTGTILTTKWLFAREFPHPLTVTAYANAITCLWAALAVGVRGQGFEVPSKTLLRNYVAPIGLCAALEIGCSNVALEMLTVSFSVILKGAAPLSTFGWCLLLGVERFSWHVGVALLLVATGIVLASLGEGAAFAAAGFALQLTALGVGGFRWALLHKLLQGSAAGRGGSDEAVRGDGPARARAPLSPLATVLYTAPVTGLAVLPFAIALEWTCGPAHREGEGVLSACRAATDHENATLDMIVVADEEDDADPWLLLGIMTLIATLVFVLLMTEFWLVRATSSLTLSVAAVFKELLTIGGGVLFFSEAFDALNAVGFATCQVGVLAYAWLRTEGVAKGTGTGTGYTPVSATAVEAEHET